MAYIVGEPCVNCKYGDCVDACPVDCFYQDDNMLYINPAECIDCDACVPECPVDAIFRRMKMRHMTRPRPSMLRPTMCGLARTSPTVMRTG